MRVIRLSTYGGPEVLRLDDLPRPDPGTGELLVEVEAVGVALPVVRLTRGDADGTGVPLPHVPGGDVAGRVAAIGSGITGWQVGQRVAAIAFSGAYAEYVVVPAAFATPVPDDMHADAAAVLVRSGQVALAALQVAGLQAGESVLVTGAAGGVGHLAVQLARVAGAGRVVAAVGAAEKAEALRALGVDEVMTYAEVAPERPVDVVLDGVGAEVQARCLDVLGPWGRLVAYSGAAGIVDVNQLRMHARTVVGFAMAHFARTHPEAYRRNGEELWNVVRSGRLRPIVHRSLPLSAAPQAHRILERRENIGKVLLRPGS